MWAEVDALLQGAIDQGVMPGCALSVWAAGSEVHAAAFGHAELRPQVRRAVVDTPWDLASLTKVLGTTPIAMALVDEGLLDLDAPLQRVLPDAPAGVTAAHCLSHTSGLPPWRPLYQMPDVVAAGLGSAAARAHALAAAGAVPVTDTPGNSHAYSDLGFLLLCSALEALAGCRLDALFETRVRVPGGLDLRWGWQGAAATEDCPVRGKVVIGEVHDLNAHAMGGISSHAGLFGCVTDVAASAAWQLRAWQGDDSAGLSPGVVRRFWSHSGAGSHHFGWDGVSASESSAGARWPRDGVGHLGFTGCSQTPTPLTGRGAS